MNLWRFTPFSAVAVLSVALLAAVEVHAGTSPVAVILQYSAVEGCPDVDTFKGIVVDRLGADAFAEDAPSRVVVHITSHGQSFEGNMEWLDAKGNWAGDRAFPAHSSDCQDLARAMAFTLALHLQLAGIGTVPTSTNSAPAEASPPTGASSSPPPPPVNDRPVIDPRELPAKASEPAQSPRARRVFAVGAGTLIGFGMSSSVVPFGRVFGSVGWPHWSLELATEVALPATIRRPDGAGFSRQEVLASVAGCGVLQAFSACALVKAGAIRVAGKNIDVPASATGPILETGLRVRATQRFYRNANVSAYAEGLVLPILWAVTLDHSLVWTSPRFAGTIGLDVALGFE